MQHPFSRLRDHSIRWMLGVLLVGLAGRPLLADGMSDIDACYRAYREGVYDRAIALCSRGLQSADLSDENLALGFVNRGMAYRAIKDYDRAIQDYDAAIKLRPNYAEAYYDRGNAYVYLDRYDRGIEDYDRAIELRSDLATAYAGRGWAYRLKGEYDRALQDFDRAIELDPNEGYPYYSKGMTYQYKGDFAQSIQNFDKAIELQPDYVPSHKDRGITLNQMGRYEQALADYKEVSRRDPQDEFVRLLEATALFYLARYDEAAGLLVDYIKKNPKDQYGVIYLYLARRHAQVDGTRDLDLQAKGLDLDAWPGPLVKYLQARISQADALKAADDPDPKIAAGRHCEAQFYFGEMELLNGRADRAKDHFQRTLDVCPKAFLELGGAKAELSRL